MAKQTKKGKKSRKLSSKIGGKGYTDLLPPTAGATLLIDADIICYQGVMDPFAYREERHNTEHGQEWTYHLNVGAALDAITRRIEEWQNDLRADKVILCWGGEANWRRRVHVEYKANRNVRKPLGYGSMRELLSKLHQSISWPHLEADDVLGVLATKNPDECVIVSEDKDMATLPARWWNPRSQQYMHSSKTEADVAHMTQTLTGDATDNYKGCPSVGAKGAMTLLAPCGSDSVKMWQAVVGAFEKAGLDEAEALRNAQVAFILRDGYYDPETGEMQLWQPPTAAKKRKRSK